MDLEAVLKQVDPPKRGFSKANKPYVFVDAVVETLGPYPSQVRVRFWGNHAETVLETDLGRRIVFNVILESREYMGKWYTEVQGSHVNTH